MIQLHLDTDIGSEMTDALALALAVISPEIELTGVTTVTGDTYFRAEATHKILDLLNKDEIPVAAGARISHMEIGWEYKTFSITPPVPDVPQKAAKLIVDAVNNLEGELVLVAIGTLTNIAEALLIDPLLPKKVKQLLVMGGMIEPPTIEGNKIPVGFEYNFCHDVTAVKRVLMAGFNLTILPGDLTFRADSPWTDEEMIRLEDLAHSVVKILTQLSEKSLKNLEDWLSGNDMPSVFAQRWANDELLMSYLLEPELFRTEKRVYALETSGTYVTFKDDPQGIRLQVIVDAELKKVRESILRRLSDLEFLKED